MSDDENERDICVECGHMRKDHNSENESREDMCDFAHECGCGWFVGKEDFKAKILSDAAVEAVASYLCRTYDEIGTLVLWKDIHETRKERWRGEAKKILKSAIQKAEGKAHLKPSEDKEGK